MRFLGHLVEIEIIIISFLRTNAGHKKDVRILYGNY